MTSRIKGRKKEAKNKVDYDKVICSMSEWVAGPGKKEREHTILHSKEESVNSSSQWPWGSLVFCQNFWLDVMQRLSSTTSAEKMLEWWSKMCRRKCWQHAHGWILNPEWQRNHFSRSCYLSFYIMVIMDTHGHWVNLSSICSIVYHQRVEEWTPKGYCRFPQLFP